MGFLDGLFGGALSGSNHDDPLGNLGKKFQKYTDPISMIPGGIGDKWTNLTSVEIPRMVNTGLSKVMQPFEKVDKTINPVRQYVPGVDSIGNWVAQKPGSTIGALVGSYFAAPAIMGAAGGAGAGGGAAAAGEGAGAASGIGAGVGGADAGALGGAVGYGGGVQSSVLPGIFEGANVGSGTGAGAGIFGGGAGTGSITGAGGMFGAGGGNLFGSGGLSSIQQQLMQQAGKNSGGQPQQQQQSRPLGAAQDPGQQAYVAPFQPTQMTPAVKQQMLAQALKSYLG